MATVVPRGVAATCRCVQQTCHAKAPRVTRYPASWNRQPPSSSRGLSTTQRMAKSFPAWFVRGGTSNGLVIHRDNLPAKDQWHEILAPAMGSPDPHGRQLNGIGSGISSTSKIIVLGPPSDPSVADVDYTFVQVGIRDGVLDMAGNCGNMSSAVGPVAWDWDVVSAKASHISEEDGELWASLRLFNTNTSKVLLSHFKVARDGSGSVYKHTGDYAIDGVAGTGSKITMSFLDPAGAKTGKMLPTGNPIDELQLSDGSTIPASLVDVSNPGVFITTRGLGLKDADLTNLTPASVEADGALKARLEEIRRAGAAKMGMDPDVESVPKVVVLFSAPQQADVDVQCQALSMGQAHKAVPLTLALCLGAAAQLPGTLAAKLRARGSSSEGGGSQSAVTIGHPSGKLDIGTTLDDKGNIVSAELLRTARVLMKGDVCF